VPVIEANEKVVFLAHFEQGFALLVSDFFQDFLDYFDLQPHQVEQSHTKSTQSMPEKICGYLVETLSGHF
jgi:hypothetical protein